MLEERKAIVLILLFFILYLAFGLFNYASFGIVNNGQDFKFHFEKLNGIGSGNYSPLYYLIFFPFGFNEFVFYLVNLLIIVVLIPFLIFKFSKAFYSVLCYFMAVPLAHMMIYGATYPQALILVLLLIYLIFRKNYPLLVFFWILASLLHSKGFYLFAIVFMAELIEARLKSGKVFFPVVFLKESTLSLHTAFQAFFTLLPAPFIYFALKAAKSNFYLILVLTSIISSFFELRALAIAELIVAVFLGVYLKTADWRIKVPILVACFFYLLWYVSDFGLGTFKMIIN